jgi:3',5'-cyclic-AMP phosphodiesterase
LRRCVSFSIAVTTVCCLAIPVKATSAPISTTGAAPAGQQPIIAFSVISDVHLRAGVSDWGVPYRDRRAERKFASALQDLHRIAPSQDLLVINGDLTVTGMPSDYEDMNEIMKQYPHPRALYAMGNHEFYAAYHNKSGRRSPRTFPNGITEEKCISRFLTYTQMPSLYYDEWLKGYHFIVLGSESSIITNPRRGDGAYLSEAQLTWLGQKLLDSPPDKPVFVFLHEPLPFTVSGTTAHDVLNPVQLTRVLALHHQVILFTGHTHRTLKGQSKSVYRNGYTLFNDASVRNPLDVRKRPMGDSEGLYVKVYKDQVVVMARDFTHHVYIRQMTLPVASTPHPLNISGLRSP